MSPSRLIACLTLCLSGGCTQLASLPDGSTAGMDGAVPVADGCVPAAEVCDGRDDEDCDGRVDEGFDLMTDPDHCGACGSACTYDNAEGACVDGACALGDCRPGFGDCNGAPDDGCEAPLVTDARCGACDVSCVGDERCVDGDPARCSMDCPLDCSGTCVDPSTSEQHCGGCDQPCELDNALEECVAGICTVAECSSGFADCNDDDADGCEVEIDVDPDACGGCGVSCGAGEETCVARQCACGALRASGGPSCPSGTLCCGDECVDAAHDERHCGTCGNACGSGETCCDGACVDTESELAHCGGCADEGGEACGTFDGCCRGNCRDLRTSESHCGACSNACLASQTCTGRECRCGGDGDCRFGETCAGDLCSCGGGAACDGTDICCGGVCVDGVNTTDCGACANTCGAMETCAPNPSSGDYMCRCRSTDGAAARYGGFDGGPACSGTCMPAPGQACI